MVLQNHPFINGADVRKMHERQRVRNSSTRRVSQIRRDEKQAEQIERFNQAKIEQDKCLKALKLEVGVTVRQKLTGDVYQVRAIKELGKGRVPEVYVDGLKYAINPLSLERV